MRRRLKINNLMEFEEKKYKSFPFEIPPEAENLIFEEKSGSKQEIYQKSPEATTSQSLYNKNRVVKVLILIVAVASIGLVFAWFLRVGADVNSPYLFNPNIITYQDAFFGVRLDYPLGWKLLDFQEFTKKLPVSHPFAQIAASAENTKGIILVQEEGATILIFSQKLSEEEQLVSLKDLVGAMVDQMEKSKVEVSSVKQALLSGYPSYQIIYDLPAEKDMLLITIKRDQIYWFFYAAPTDSENIFYKKFDQTNKIIESFEFIN